MCNVFKNWNIIVIAACGTMSLINAKICITPLQGKQIPELKETIISAWNEVLDMDRTTAGWEKNGHFDDINDFQTKFIRFLVLRDNEKVVGSAGIKPLSPNICELKRMWILKQYRHHGWGSQLLTMLEDEARLRGYQYMRLEVYIPTKQQQALAFFRKFGFYTIAPYSESRPDAIFMEKQLGIPYAS